MNGGISILLKNLDFSKLPPIEGIDTVETDNKIVTKTVSDSSGATQQPGEVESVTKHELDWEFSDESKAKDGFKTKPEDIKSDSEKRILTREFKTELPDEELLTREELDSKLSRLNRKQESLLSLEKQNVELQAELKSKIDEYEKKSKKLTNDREQLMMRERELENNSLEYEEKMKALDIKSEEIEHNTAKLAAECEKFDKAKQEYKVKVLNYQEKLRKEISKELFDELERSKADLESEWGRLQAEEERLSGVYRDMMKAKNTFKDKFEKQIKEINKQRQELAKEWGNVKKVRKILEEKISKLDNYTGGALEKEQLMDIDKQIKKSLEDQMLSDLENKLRMEITEQLSKEYLDSKAMLENEWSKLRKEQKKLANIQDKLLSKRRGKSKTKFNSRLKKLMKTFGKNKLKKAELEALEAEFLADEEHRQQELAVEEQRKCELDNFAQTLEAQRKELDNEREELAEEWRYITKIREKLLEEKSNSKPEAPQEASDSESYKLELIKDGNKELDKELEKEKESDHEDDGELTKELENLQVELKKEWNELKEQHERLSQARKEFSKARKAFEIEHESKMKKLDKIPISQMGLDKLFKSL
ncbi:hypothetical protein [[Eubacterium] cellulosolvens]